MACLKLCITTLALFAYLNSCSLFMGANASEAGTSAAPAGPYKTKVETFSYWLFDWSDTHVDVIYPIAEDNQTFPLISYAHGYSNLADGDYGSLFQTLASWGYVVVAPKTCRYGCFTPWNCQSLEHDPLCYGTYYKMQLLAIDWARGGSAKLPINFGVGVGVAGHSMGGQATLYSAAKGATSHDIRAAVLHHPYTHSFPSIQKVPFLVFTSTNDTVAIPQMAEQVFNATGAFSERGFVERVDNPEDPDPHGEPDRFGFNNSGIKWFTVAWFKVHLDKTPRAHGIDFEDLLYGGGVSSLCHGGDGPMRTCSLLRAMSNADSHSNSPAIII